MSVHGEVISYGNENNSKNKKPLPIFKPQFKTVDDE